jgi:hypothetical protein
MSEYLQLGRLVLVIAVCRVAMAAWRVRCWWIRYVWPAPGGAVDRLIISGFYLVAVGVVRLRAWAS